jgi:NAD(P)-dependent dehydrogenase (short-subunit alcohol dehydrogenase family)
MPDTPSLPALLSLQGKVALVTGGCQNFGTEISTGLAEMGAHLVVTSRQADKAAAAAASLAQRHGIRALGVALDLNSEASVVAAFDAAIAAFGHVDILVNNAGGHGSKPSGDVLHETLECFEQYVRANLTGTFLTIREFARRRVAQGGGGAIVNIASVSSLIGRDRSVYAGTPMTPNPIPYTAAKAGVIGLTYDCAASLAPHGIRVNAISPGGFERGQPAPFVAAYSSHTMLGRMGRDGWDLKGAVAYLASDAAAYVTAHNLVLDGGFTRYR